jgi:hypothetical protein
LETAKITIATEEMHDDVNELQSSLSFSSVSSSASKDRVDFKEELRKVQMTLWSILQDTLPKNIRLVYQIWVTTLTKSSQTIITLFLLGCNSYRMEVL